MSTRYIPNRNDIIWLDFEPTKGKEIGKYRPAYVLSSRQYNEKTTLLICCPISTSIRGQVSEVPLDCLDQPSVIATSIIQTLDWKNRSAKYITCAPEDILDDVLCRVIPLIGGEHLL